MNKKITLLTDRLRLKTLRVEDITSGYVEGLNDPEVNRFLVNVRLTRQTPKTIAVFVRRNLKAKDSLLFGMFRKSDGVLVGTIRISGISFFHFFCSVGICIFDRGSWGKGYAAESMAKVCDFVFMRLKLHYIEAGVYETNRASMGLFRRAGFKVIARYRDKYRYDKNFAPVVIWGKTNEHSF